MIMMCVSQTLRDTLHVLQILRDRQGLAVCRAGDATADACIKLATFAFATERLKHLLSRAEYLQEVRHNLYVCLRDCFSDRNSDISLPAADHGRCPCRLTATRKPLQCRDSLRNPGDVRSLPLPDNDSTFRLLAAGQLAKEFRCYCRNYY
jgi:hypothetical protein